MLMYFLIWFALGLYGFTYLTILDYLNDVTIEISVGNILLFVVISAIFGATLAVWSMGHTFSGLFSLLGKPICTLKRNKK